jgi:hypothetical protein
MKTKELAHLLRPLSPCTRGLHRLLKHETVRQWWSRCNVSRDLFYVWSFVATADGDNVFARELGEWERGLPGYDPEDGGVMEEMVADCREHGPDRFPGVFCGKSTADQFRATFRCPTDAELRMAGRWFAEREW